MIIFYNASMLIQHLLLTFCIVIIWGVNFIAIRLALDGFSPYFLCTLRFFLASLPVFFVPLPQKYLWTFFYGFLMFGVQFTLLFLGINAGLSPGLASVLLQLQAFFSILLAPILLKEPLKGPQILSTMIAFSGVGFIALHTNGQVCLPGLLLVLAAAFLWGLCNFIAKKAAPSHPLSFVGWSSLVAWPFLAIFSLYIEGFDSWTQNISTASYLSWSSLFYIAGPTTLFGFTAWNYLIQKYKISLLAPFTLLVPCVGMASSVLFLGEEWTSWKAIAMILIISGLLLHLLNDKIKYLLQSKRSV